MCAAAGPASASAAVVELGATASPVLAPACPKNVSPANCTIILTQSTALETVRDGIASPTVVKQAGQIVAFTVGLSALSSNRTTSRTDIHYLDQTYGGTTRAAVTVLRRTGAASLRRWTVIAESPMIHLQPYLGQVVQIPLATTLPVLPGDTIALTTSTWVPVLSIDVSRTRFAYRQSRSSNCNNPATTSQAQLRPGVSTQYVCNYPGTRVEYSATEVTSPVALDPIHVAFRPAAGVRSSTLRAAHVPDARPAPSGGAAVAR